MLPLERLKLQKDVGQVVPDWASNDRSILMGLRGSDAHGTKIDKGPNDIDDVDVFSIIVHPMEYYLGLDGYHQKHEHWDSAGKDLDVLVYDVRKFMHLAAQGNPNVLAWLWNREGDYLYIDQFGNELIYHRHMFMSKHIFKRLAGYAFSQMERMNADKKYRGYMGAERKGLVDEFGYDLKNAAHCIRLMYMSISLAKEGTLYSYRPERERELIMNVKRGLYTLEDVTNMIQCLMNDARDAEKYSDLPDNVDRERISKLLHTIIFEFNSL